MAMPSQSVVASADDIEIDHNKRGWRMVFDEKSIEARRRKTR
jgi:hypothetical protein